MNQSNKQLKAYNITVTGKVQRVGYRRYILDLAQKLNLKGHIKNQPDGSVQIFIQGPKGKIEKFIEELKQPPLGKVEVIQLKEVDVNPNIKIFKIIYGELVEELHEGFGAMQNIFLNYWREFRDYRKEFRDFTKKTDENFKTILEKYGEISEKPTTILETLVRESKETRETLNQTMKLLKQAIEKLSK